SSRDLYLAVSAAASRAVSAVSTAYRAWSASSDRWEFVRGGVLQSKPWWKWLLRTQLLLGAVLFVGGQLSTSPNLRLLSDQSPPLDGLLTGAAALTVMVGSLWFAAGRIVAGLLGSSRFGVRLLARLTACAWLLSVGFNLLINLGRFRLFGATCLWLLVAGG